MANNFLFLRTLNSPYIGNAPDTTRNSVLSHNDVDNNFIFLKGEDILTATTTGTTIVFDKVNSDTIEVDLQGLIDCVNIHTTGTTLEDGILYFDTTKALSAYTADLTPLIDDTNFYTTGTTTGANNIVYFNRTDALSAYTLDLNPYLDDTNFYTTGGTVVNEEIVFDRTDSTSAYTVDVSSLITKVDYGNIIFVSEVGTTGQTRGDVVGDINKPVGLEWATQIAQSGDTIHVKSGTYNITTTAPTGLSVDGVNHYFEPGAKVYKATGGVMFGKFDGVGTLNEANVFGSGSFYGSGSCGVIFFNFGFDSTGSTQTYEWDICENTSDACYASIFNGDTVLRGKRRMISTGGDAIRNASPNTLAKLTVDCPLIKSTIGYGINHTNGAGTVGNLKVDANEIIGASTTFPGIDVTKHGADGGHDINANYINYVGVSDAGGPLKLNLNVSRIDRLVNFQGTYLNVNGHLGWLSGSFTGIADIKLIDRCWPAGSGVVNTTFNGDFDYTSDASGTNLISAVAGNIICNYRLQKPAPTPGPFQYDFVDGWFFSNASGTMNMLGNWDIQNWWITHASGRINIPSGTVINIGPMRDGTQPGEETFNVVAVTMNISGDIIERCDTSAPCDDSQSAQTYSNRIMLANPDNTSQDASGKTRIIYNGATIIVRNQNSQLITTSVTGGTIGIYSGGLNTNKQDAFEAEQEKLRVSVTGTSAEVEINGETFNPGVWASPAIVAQQLVSDINASGTLAATASQDNPGVDEYIYVEADVAGDALTMGYNLNTALDTVIRYNTQTIIDTIGGTLIEDPEIVRDQFN